MGLHFAVNVKGPFLLTKAVLPHMIQRRAGHIIHLTGSGAYEVSSRIRPSSGATKAALDRFIRGVAKEVRAHNVAVNCFDPGPVKTERAVHIRGANFDWTGFATPADTGPACVALACHDANTMTGQVFKYLDYARAAKGP